MISRKKAFSMLLFLQFLVYVDRGIVSGCSRTLSQFLIKVTNTSTPSFYLGVVQSSFIAGLCIMCLALANATKYKSLTFLIGLGMVIWMISGLICGTSVYVGSYGFATLLTGRILSGVGEASLISLIPPFILQNSDGKATGFWMGAFSAVLPLGVSAGFVYGAFFAEVLQWNFAFYIETCISIPLLGIIIWYPKLLENEKTITVSVEDDSILRHESKKNLGSTEMNKSEEIHRNKGTNLDTSHTYSISKFQPTSSGPNSYTNSFRLNFWLWLSQFCSDILVVLKSIEFLALTVTTASYAAVISVFLVFGPSYLHNLGFVRNELDASILMGSVTLVSGVFGSLLGGAISAVATGSSHSKLNKKTIEQQQQQNVEIALNVDQNEEKTNWIINREIITEKSRSSRSNCSEFSVTPPVIIESETREEFVEPYYLFVASSTVHEDRQMEKLMLHLIPITILSTILFCILAFSENIYVFTITLVSGLFAIFAAQSSITIGIMLSVPVPYQNLAIALSILFMHILGDVPAPVIVGFLKDTLAPHCSIPETLTQDCINERLKLRFSILITSLWLIWMVLGIIISYVTSVRRRKLSSSNSNAAKVPRTNLF